MIDSIYYKADRMKHKIDLICNIHIDDLIQEIVKCTRRTYYEVIKELEEEYLYPDDSTDYTTYTNIPVDEPSWIYDEIDSILSKLNDFDEVRIFK